jgi:sialic acid synthase SpsE
VGAYIVAEIGTSHGGDSRQLAKLVQAVAESGADCAKFQWVYADEILHPNSGMVPLPGGPVALYDRFKALEVGTDFFRAAQNLCAQHQIDFLCTPFGFRSARELYSIGAQAFKLASPELNHHALAELLASSHLPLIISSGVSTLADIDETLAVIQAARQGHYPQLNALTEQTLVPQPALNRRLPPLTLLHCLTAYPAPENEFNLLLIRTLSGVFGLPVGISDHSLDPLLVPVISVLLGASLVEKHFTLSNDSDGLDDPIALSPKAFHRMVKAIRKAETLAQSWRERNVRVNLTTEAIGLILTTLNIKIDDRRVLTMLGSGAKKLAPSEAANYGRTNRSLHLLCDQKAGTTILPSTIAPLRTEKVLRPGLHPRYLPLILGRRLVRDISAGEGLVWNDLW